MRKSLSRFRRYSALPAASLSNWRPRVSSPLTSEITFESLDEKYALKNDMDNSSVEEVAPRRIGTLQIGFSLLMDSLLSFWLCRVAMDNLLSLRWIFAAIPPPFNQPGTVLFCSSNDYFNTNDYPKFSPEQSLDSLSHLPTNCVFLPNLIVSIGQSPMFPKLVPIGIACFITLKLAFGYLFLRTSLNPNAPCTYLKATTAFHLLVSYTAFLYIHLHMDLLLHRYPRFEKVFQVSSECIFFLAGVIVCLCLLSIAVVPLLWICSRCNQSTEQVTITSRRRLRKLDDNANHLNPNLSHLKKIPRQKKRFYFAKISKPNSTYLI
ncbi:hypothetical protein O181_029336 [Austropuccinia psidii MF-1]|uniref:Uncharacterized protein n=1 Tax=Austropuccinia psidii MF-1 TaxID=1389203 RepID=A0A9Q3CW95_9BASI|nr:hypothetical protein [Austropuccinia psidii MF-1]